MKKSNSKRNLLGIKTVIRTKDFDSAKKFYHEILALEIVQEYDDNNGSKGCIMKFDDSALIEISEIKPAHDYYQRAFDEPVPNDKMDIQIRTDSIDFWAEKLSAIWQTRGPIDRPWGSRYLYLRDPDGVHIIIYQESR